LPEEDQQYQFGQDRVLEESQPFLLHFQRDRKIEPDFVGHIKTRSQDQGISRERSDGPPAEKEMGDRDEASAHCGNADHQQQSVVYGKKTPEPGRSTAGRAKG
jgi:hypothetical protein